MCARSYASSQENMGSAESIASAMSSCVQLPSMSHEAWSTPSFAWFFG